MKHNRNSATIRNPFARWATTMAALLVLASGAGAQQAGIQGIILQRDGQRIPSAGAGVIRWLPAREAYIITADGVRLEIPLRQVDEVRTAKPRQFDAAENAVRTRRYAPAIPVLEKIVTDYRRLQWDIPAARLLTQAYMGMGNPAEAAKKAEVAISGNPDVWQDMEFARLYWDALSKSGQSGRLGRILLQGIEHGSRETAAAAQIMRGNIDFDQGRYRDALVDGYLRTIMLFRDVKQVQPEALYRAVRAHEQLGEHSHAEKFKKMLLSDYPQSSYSKDLRSGS